MLYIKVIKREQELVLMMMWGTWKLIWLIMMDVCLVAVQKGGECRGHNKNVKRQFRISLHSSGCML